MRTLAVSTLLLVALLAGCGGGPSSAENVVRAWSRAVNGGDNEAAARLFAPGARVVQGALVTRLETRAAAVAWNASLPCSGRIVELSSKGDTATATFVLGHRRTSRCDGPGERARAVFRIDDGKIVVWHQLAAVQGPSTVI